MWLRNQLHINSSENRLRSEINDSRKHPEVIIFNVPIDFSIAIKTKIHDAGESICWALCAME